MNALRSGVVGIGIAGMVSCGGGVGEVIAVLGYAGAAGGIYTVDDDKTTVALEHRACAGGGDCNLFLNVGNATNAELYQSTFPVTASGDLGSGNCGNVTGTISGRKLQLPGCFSGEFKSVSEVVSDDGNMRLLFSFFPNFTDGAWFDINNAKYRIKFTGTNGVQASGCELDDVTKTPTTLDYLNPDLDAGVYASIQNVKIIRPGGVETWAAEYFGTAGLRLTRGTLVRELQRRSVNETC
jgi:hypothetical protein